MIRPQQKMRIGELLVREGLITEQQLREALDMQKDKGGKVVQNLIFLQYLDRHDFLKFLSHQPGMASIDLLNYTISKDVIGLIPADFAVKNEIFPIDKMGSYLTVAMACPLDDKAVNELKEITGLKVRALLVSMEDINEALNRYYPSAFVAKQNEVKTQEKSSVNLSDIGALAMTLPKVETAMTLDAVLNLVSKVKELPALPRSVQKIRELMDEPETLTQDVVDVIERDPALSAKTISLANSAAFSIKHKVDNVLMATTMLGLREIYSLVLSTAVIEHFDNSPNFNYKAHWRRSLTCASAAKLIRQACGQRGGSTIFAAGLLYDLGQLVLAHLMPKRYHEIDTNLTDAELINVENRVFGISHPEVGFALAEQWQLPDEIAIPVRFHHNPSIANSNKEAVATVALAAALTDQIVGREPDKKLGDAGQDAAAMLGLESDTINEIIESLSASAE